VSITPALLRTWPLPDRHGSKDERGAVLVVGGARRTPGAAHIAGLAALRSRPLTLIDCALSLGLDREPTDCRTCRAVVVEHEGHLYGLMVEAADDIVAALAEPGPLGADPGPGWSRVASARIETEAGALPCLDIAALIAGPEEALAA